MLAGQQWRRRSVSSNRLGGTKAATCAAAPLGGRNAALVRRPSAGCLVGAPLRPIMRRHQRPVTARPLSLRASMGARSAVALLLSHSGKFFESVFDKMSSAMFQNFLYDNRKCIEIATGRNTKLQFM
ncbi:hypothetical protein MTO96_032021 [Rhipicephalus appendiculatus]